MSFIHGDGLRDVVITGRFQQDCGSVLPANYVGRLKHLKYFTSEIIGCCMVQKPGFYSHYAENDVWQL